MTVGQVADLVATSFGAPIGFALDDQQPHEAGLLALDSRKAQVDLGWRNRLGFERALEWTVQWERAIAAGSDARSAALEQIQRFASV